MKIDPKLMATGTRLPSMGREPARTQAPQSSWGDIQISTREWVFFFLGGGVVMVLQTLFSTPVG